jgi:thymidine kinase
MIAGSGYLEMIIGPMFSGKSTMLIQRADQYELCGRSVLMVNHKSDIRYGSNAIRTHGDHKKDAVMVGCLRELDSETYMTHDVICIDEGQFFEDLYVFVQNAVMNDKKNVVISCLHSTFNLTPFKNVCSLLSYADLICPMRALCMLCKNGTPAPFTKKLNNNANNIGSHGDYMPVCRAHHTIREDCVP